MTRYLPCSVPIDALVKVLLSVYANSWCSSVGRASDRHAFDAGLTPRCSRLSYGVHTPPHSITYINICAHIKDPVVNVRVWWIMKTLKHPACTVGWVGQLCHSWLSPRKPTQISHGINPNKTIQSGYIRFSSWVGTVQMLSHWNSEPLLCPWLWPHQSNSIKPSLVPKGSAVQKTYRKSYFDYMILQCDLDLADRKSIFFEDNLAHDDASPYPVW